MTPQVIVGDSVNDVAASALLVLGARGRIEESRNGGVCVMDGPVLIQTRSVRERVMFSPKRNANPFFHLFEALWMLAGRNDIAWLAQFNKRMATYSDDAVTQPAAYGHRWINHFGHDQLQFVIDELKRDPASRRAVLTMWDGAGDPAAVANKSADVPCNTNCFFTVRDGRLYMSVQCRSNDAIWGAHGANAVHFSILQEYIAAAVGVELGEMFQYAWNYHVYIDVVHSMGGLDFLAFDIETFDWYASGAADSMPLVGKNETPDVFMADVKRFCQLADPRLMVEVRNKRGAEMDTLFMSVVALPMLGAWDNFKLGRQPGLLAAYDNAGNDWLLAADAWLERRWAAKLERGA